MAAGTLKHTGTSIIKGVTPLELWLKRQLSRKNLYFFRQEVIVHATKEERRTPDAKARKGRFIDYGEKIKGTTLMVIQCQKKNWHREERRILMLI